MNEQRPLFIALKRQWFEAFAAGIKQQEIRLHGARWNERTCAIGRAVTLSLGYTKTRLRGRVVSFHTQPCAGLAEELYGAGATCAVIGIELA